MVNIVLFYSFRKKAEQKSKWNSWDAEDRRRRDLLHRQQMRATERENDRHEFALRLDQQYAEEEVVHIRSFLFVTLCTVVSSDHPRPSSKVLFSSLRALSIRNSAKELAAAAR